MRVDYRERQPKWLFEGGKGRWDLDELDEEMYGPDDARAMSLVGVDLAIFESRIRAVYARLVGTKAPDDATVGDLLDDVLSLPDARYEGAEAALQRWCEGASAPDSANPWVVLAYARAELSARLGAKLPVE